MKILHCFWAYLYPSENWIYRLLTGTSSVKIHIAAENFLKNAFLNPDFTYFKYPFQYLSGGPAPVLRLSNKILDRIRTHYPYQRYLKDVARIHRINILHAHFAHMGWEYLPLAKKLRIPYVISFYGFDYESLPNSQPEFKERYQMLFKEADAFICEGNHGAGILSKIGCPREKIHVVKLGVDSNSIPFFKRNKKSGELKLVQVAAFREKKGQLDTLKAFEKALPKCPGIELTLAGYGDEPYKQQILEYIHNSIFLKGRMNFIEFQEGVKFDYYRLHGFLKDFHVFIHPSRYAGDMDCEGGAPVVLLDAQATGMPVISTRHCDIPSEVIHGCTGFLAQEKNVEELSEYICAFYRMNNENYQKFAGEARSHVMQNYESAKNSNDILPVYKSLIE
ncbi:MAG: glycosyltransferase family 4 protein [Bacteroidetes bacterium]|nr:glycosyltransferase family 4 protein [Bacteroidota bacterium]